MAWRLPSKGPVGPEAGAVTLALDSLVLAWHRRMGVDKAAFNFANLTAAVWTSGSLFVAASGVAPLPDGGQAAGRLILPLALLLVVALQQVHFAAFWLVPPVRLVFYYTLRSSFGRVEDAKGHVARGTSHVARDPAHSTNLVPSPGRPTMTCGARRVRAA